MSFEGIEKKLEIILKQPIPDLAKNLNRRWDRIVNEAHTEIISSIHNPFLSAYLLSESSLFVYPNRIVAITCGESQLYRAVPAILELVSLDNVLYLFYQRKNYIFPERQLNNFNEEVRWIEDYLPGTKKIFGPRNHDHIYLLFCENQPQQPIIQAEDITLEILMHEIDQHKAQFFYQEKMQGHNVFQSAQLGKLLPSSVQVDDYLFYPCGYSFNAIDRDSYYTMHITPQPECSYVSFECNALLSNYQQMMEKVIGYFSPRRCCVIVTGNVPSKPGCSPPNKYLHTFQAQECLGTEYQITFHNYSQQSAQQQMA